MLEQLIQDCVWLRFHSPYYCTISHPEIDLLKGNTAIKKEKCFLRKSSNAMIKIGLFPKSAMETIFSHHESDDKQEDVAAGRNHEEKDKKW